MREIKIRHWIGLYTSLSAGWSVWKCVLVNILVRTSRGVSRLHCGGACASNVSHMWENVKSASLSVMHNFADGRRPSSVYWRHFLFDDNLRRTTSIILLYHSLPVNLHIWRMPIQIIRCHSSKFYFLLRLSAFAVFIHQMFYVTIFQFIKIIHKPDRQGCSKSICWQKKTSCHIGITFQAYLNRSQFAVH